MEKIKVILADDHTVVLDGLQAVLRDQPDIEVVGIATHGEQALALLRSTEPDVVVLDISMPGLNGKDTAREILKKHPKTKVLILSMHAEYSYIRALREMHVHGYLLKGSSSKEVLDAIRSLAEGRDYFSREVNEIYRTGPKPTSNGEMPHFTKREKEVLSWLAKGLDNPDIADKMCVGLATVESHMRSLRSKINQSGARALVVFAIENGFGDLHEARA
ncbi:MAG: response regulator transcription factor [Bacteroidia bacterium]